MKLPDCRPWCTDHVGGEDSDDMCVAPGIHLDFGTDSDALLVCNTAATDLTESLDGQCLMLHINGHPVVELDPDQTAAIGWALLAQDAQARGDAGAAKHYTKLAHSRARSAAVRSAS